MFVCISFNTHIGVINMSVLLALAIIVAVIAAACTVKAVRSATKVAPCVDLTTYAATKPHADVVTSVVDIVNPDCMEAVVMVLSYTKASLKEERLNGRRARARAWHIANCASKEAARKARKDAMAYISAAQRNAENKTKANQWMVGKSWQEAISALYNEGKLISVRKHREVKTATMRVHKPRVVRARVSAAKPAYVRHIKANKAANKPNVISGTQLGQQARATGATLVTQIRVAKATLASLYVILPLARQVVALQSKASRKVGMYTWLADEGHVGVRATKSSVARRDAAQEVVCQAALAAEAFKKAYGIEAQDVASQILAVKAAKARAVEMLRNHKAEQHRLFLERQERRAAKAALKAAKGKPASIATIAEVADWEQYVPSNNGNKAIAFGFLSAKTATMAEKISAAIAIVGDTTPEHELVICQTADAAYGVAA